MHLRYALLALLAEGEAHGYVLFKRCTARLGPFWHPNIGQVYQLLRQLEGRGLVAQRADRRGRRARHVFRVTARGERALATWLTRRPGWPPPVRPEILVRLLAAERAGTAAVREQLDRQEAEYRRYLDVVRSEASRAPTELTRRLADAAAVTQAEAQLDWLVRCRTLLAATLARAS
jgi:DNA-binding PadR family transcriptional regulator